jgi:pyruvate/2-oxoacid:ferredoxin oxidoreductase alpha subunit
VCGKVKQPKLRAKPIEEVIKEKQQKAKPVIEEKPIEPPPPPPPPPPEKPDYWALRREYTNQLKERKQQLVKRLVSKAF